MNMLPLRFLLFLIAYLLTGASHALPFNIFPVPGFSLPTSVISGQTVYAFYTVENNTGSTRVNNFVKYLPPNVQQVTSNNMYPDLCAAQFTLAARGMAGSSCTLILSISGAVNAQDPAPHHHLFVCFPGGISCVGTSQSLNVTTTIPTLQTRGVCK